MTKIVQKKNLSAIVSSQIEQEDKILYRQTIKVNLDKINSKKIQNIIKNMKKTLATEKEGVAIAANQIGEALRIFVVSGKIFATEKDRTIPKDRVFINPKLVKISKDKNLMEEGCLSVKNTYGFVKRSNKASVRAYDENGKQFTLGGSGLLAQIFQHEIDHLNGILFTEKAKDLRKISKQINMAFFGTSSFSAIVLEELKKTGLIPSLIITAPNKPKGRGLKMTPPEVKVWADKNMIKTLQPNNITTQHNQKFILDSIREINSEKPDLLIVASYGKIIPKEILNISKYGTLNVHPSLLPKLRGASPIKTAILNNEKDFVGVTIMLLDEKMDHGPILDQKKVNIEKWPIKASMLENILAREGGKLLVEVIPNWIDGNIKPQEQNHNKATFSKKIDKKDAEINLNDNPYKNFLKIQAFDNNPRPYFFVDNKRMIIVSAEYKKGELKILRVIPEGEKETDFDNSE